MFHLILIKSITRNTLLFFEKNTIFVFVYILYRRVKNIFLMHTYTKEEEDKMILDAFHDLQKAYGASNHKHKFELVATL